MARRAACYLTTVLLIALFVLGTACCDHEYFFTPAVQTQDCVDDEDGTKQIVCANPDAGPELQGATCEAVAVAAQTADARAQAGDTAALAGQDLSAMGDSPIVGITAEDPDAIQLQKNSDLIATLQTRIKKMEEKEAERALRCPA